MTEIDPINENKFCFLSDLIEEIQRFFDQKCALYDSPQVSIEKLLKFEDGSAKKGDFSLYLPPTQYPNLVHHLEDIVNNLKLELRYFQECHIVNDCRVILILDRTNSYKEVLQHVVSLKENYGFTKNGKRGSILLYVIGNKSTPLTNLRTHVLFQHIAAILLSNGYNVICSDNIFQDSIQHDGFEHFDCEKCDFNESFLEFQQKVTASKWLLDYSDVYNSNTIDTSEVITFDCEKYFSETLGRRNYDKNIKHLLIKNGFYTDVFTESAKIYHILDKHAKSVDTVLCICPNNMRLSVQQSGLVLEMLISDKINFLYLSHQRVIEKAELQTAELYTEQRRSEMEKALVHRYGGGILNDVSWTSVIETLAQTVIKFDFLFTGFAMPLNLEPRYSDEYAVDKRGTFVQYNCARLTALLRQFETDMSKGKYQPLPTIADIDFSYLKLQEEWQLFFNYVILFPKLIDDLLKNMQSDISVDAIIATQKVCQFLVELSRDLSVYYNKNRILVQPYSQLLHTMYPRLYLIQSIHQVMKNSLAILNLLDVEKM